MKNPLNKRLPRELKKDMGKYLVVFLFMTMLISLVSGFLVAGNSMMHSYNDGFTRYNIEWGHLSFDKAPTDELLADIEKKCDITLYNLKYFEEEEVNLKANFRVYTDRQDVNLECLMKGEMPVSDNEIAIDRMFADNNDLDINDTVTLRGRELTICGLIALPDYSCLFESNNDMMFDAIGFSIGVMTEEGYAAVGSTKESYNYAWMYNKAPSDSDDTAEEKKASDELLVKLSEIVTEYDTELYMSGNLEDLISIDDFLPRYLNKAINFSGEDIGSDTAMILVFSYIVIVILAFVFAVTTSNTISEEAGVIGTLRASGYSRGELIRHYMVLPVTVTLISAIIGNILGYTYFKDMMAGIYYGSYSLTTYETLWNAQAFIDTTLVPIILMFVINLFILSHKLKLSPLRFLRHDLSVKQKKKAFRLNTKIPFIHRFRIRILFQNIPNYITLFIGITVASIVIIFGSMFGPLLEDYSSLVEDSMFAKYQYITTDKAATDINGAEKYCITEIETTDGRFMTDDISIYGIESDSLYIKSTIPNHAVLVSNGIMTKFGYKVGDTISLKDKYSDTVYDFKIAGEYKYDAALAIFMNREDFLDKFDKPDNYFSGYLSNEELSDIEDEAILTVITREDLTKVSRQLTRSMGEFMDVFKYFGAAMFLLLMYLLSKIIIEKNSQSISMVKILGFMNSEIGGLYIVATSIVVIISLVISAPVTNALLKLIFTKYIYTMMTGYIPFIISDSCYIYTILLGIACYAVVALLQLVKINRIPKSDALKNVE